jgi:hypothetical protein
VIPGILENIVAGMGCQKGDGFTNIQCGAAAKANNAICLVGAMARRPRTWLAVGLPYAGKCSGAGRADWTKIARTQAA